EAVPLASIEPLIDWTPFFQAWELRGRYPQILDEPRAKELYDDARKLLAEIVDKRLLQARAVYGFWRARANGDDIELPEERCAVPTLRQQQEPTTGVNLGLARFVAPDADFSG